MSDSFHCIKTMDQEVILNLKNAFKDKQSFTDKNGKNIFLKFSYLKNFTTIKKNLLK